MNLNLEDEDGQNTNNKVEEDKKKDDKQEVKQEMHKEVKQEIKQEVKQENKTNMSGLPQQKINVEESNDEVNKQRKLNDEKAKRDKELIKNNSKQDGFCSKCTIF